MKKFSIPLIMMLLSGCSIFQVPTNTPQNEFPEAHLVRCDDITVPSQTGVHLGDMINYSVQLQVQYNDCAIRHDETINLIRAENIRIREAQTK